MAFFPDPSKKSRVAPTNPLSWLSSKLLAAKGFREPSPPGLLTAYLTLALASNWLILSWSLLATAFLYFSEFFIFSSFGWSTTVTYLPPVSLLTLNPLSAEPVPE